MEDKLYPVIVFTPEYTGRSEIIKLLGSKMALRDDIYLMKTTSTLEILSFSINFFYLLEKNFFLTEHTLVSSAWHWPVVEELTCHCEQCFTRPTDPSPFLYI